MAKRERKKGLPAQLVEAERQKDLDEEILEQGDPLSPEDFAKQMFGQADIPQDDKGLPSLEWLKSQYKTKSAAIRYLVNSGFAIKDIAKHLGIRYQHARNVSTQTLKRGPNEDWRPKAKPPLLLTHHPEKEEPTNGQSDTSDAEGDA